jgi:hypothetical protein
MGAVGDIGGESDGMEVERHRIMGGRHRCTRAVFGASHAHGAKRARSSPRTRWCIGPRSGRPTRTSLLPSRTATTARSTRCPLCLCVRRIREALPCTEAAYVRTRSGTGSGGRRAGGEPDTVAGAPTHRAAAGFNGYGFRLMASRDALPSGLQAVLPRLACAGVLLPPRSRLVNRLLGAPRGCPRQQALVSHGRAGCGRVHAWRLSLWSTPRPRGPRPSNPSL